MLAEELAQRFGVPVECSPHLEAGVGGARGKLRAPAGAWAHQIGGDVLLAAVGEDEGFYHVQVATGVDDADQQRIVAILRDLWTGKAVLRIRNPSLLVASATKVLRRMSTYPGCRKPSG